MLRHRFIALAVFVFAAVFISVPVRAQEVITAFEARVEVQPDSSLIVTENISVRAEGNKIKRGIYRDFPTLHRFGSGSLKSTTFEVLDVLRDGRRESYHTKKINAGQRIYFGSSNVFLEPGNYTYTLRYRTGRQLRYFQDFDELYWNVTGNHWDFPIDYASIEIALPDGASILRHAAYTGREGDRRQFFTAQPRAQNRIFFETTRPLRKKEGFTVALAFPKGFVDAPSPEELRAQFWQDNKWFLIGLGILLAILCYYFFAWHHYGRDPKEGTIIPLFEPPTGFSPAMCRYVSKVGDVMWKTCFTAALVNLAVKKALVIEQISEGVSILVKQKYAVKRLEGYDLNSMSAEERGIFKALFDTSGGYVEMDEANRSILQKAFKAVKKKTKTEAGKNYFFRNQSFLIPGVLLNLLYAILLIAGLGISELLPVLLHFTVFMLIISHVMVKLLVGEKYSFWRFLGAGFAMIVLLLFPAIMAMIFSEEGADWRVGFVYCAMVIANVLFAELMVRPTMLGRKVMDEIEGFKLYLSVAEKERFEALHPPEVTPEVFEKYLPYAIALDVENEWANKFEKSMALADEAGRSYHYGRPSWYEGSDFSSRNIAAFTASFSSALATSSSSASGGGGSSGGGGGGGGGGGW